MAAEGEEDKVVLVQTLLTVNEVFVYRIPPLKSSVGHRYVEFVPGTFCDFLPPCSAYFLIHQRGRLGSCEASTNMYFDR
jgi:hypothetical protein